MLDKFSLKLLFVSALCMLIGKVATGQTPKSLSDCIQYAYDNNPQMRLAKLQIADADWRIKENKATGLPQFSAGIDYLYYLQKPIFLIPSYDSVAMKETRQKVSFFLSNSLTGQITYNQLLFNSSYLIGLKAAKYYREYVGDQMLVTQQTLRNQVIDAYLPALLLAENLLIIDKNIGNLDKLLSETRAITKAGFAEQLDVDRLDLSLTNLRNERNNLARQQEIVINVLKFAMGHPIGEPLTLSDNLNQLLAAYGDTDLSSAVNYQNRPEYIQLLKGQELNALQVEIYKKSWMPTLAGFLQYQAGLQGDNLFGADAFFIPQAVAGLSLKIPIWDGGGTKAKRERAVIAVEQVVEQKKILENAINLEVDNARKTYLNARERVSSQQKNLDLAQRIYDTTQTKYKAGIGSSFELVSTEQQLYSAQQALMQAQYDLLTAKVAVKKALGL